MIVPLQVLRNCGAQDLNNSTAVTVLFMMVSGGSAGGGGGWGGGHYHLNSFERVQLQVVKRNPDY